MRSDDPDWLDLLDGLSRDPAERLPFAERLWEGVDQALNQSRGDPDLLVEMLNAAFEANHNQFVTTVVFHWRVFAWRIGDEVAIHYGHYGNPLGVRADRLLRYVDGEWVFNEDNPESIGLEYDDVTTAIAFEIVSGWEGIP
ncbi:MAG: hypothetical protein H6740_08570 [Alphaproteobacteria bacterium]|nr:hypothetical protein [Alphaproteobacteria bacterium]